MSLAHLTLPTEQVDRTASFFERTLGYARNPVPGNSPVEALWLDIGRGQEMHVFYVEGFRTSPFEGEFACRGGILAGPSRGERPGADERQGTFWDWESEPD